MAAYMTASQLSQQYQSVLKPANKPEHEISQVTSTEDKYEVKLCINQFEPEELSVKVIDRYIHIEGRHEEKNDKIGFFTRTFTRRYFLPDGVQPEAIRCTFSVDTSILTVSAPIINKKPVKELIIPIIVVGQQLQKGEKGSKKEKERHASGQPPPPPPHQHHHRQQHPKQAYSQSLPHQHHRREHSPGQKQTSSTLPPPPPEAVPSCSTYPNSSKRQQQHYHHHLHQQDKQQLHIHQHHRYQDYPSAQMHF